jgi:type I restriction enzyme S subunit
MRAFSSGPQSLARRAGFPLPLFSLQEQCRIVEAIESYFTRLDDAVATLERVQRNLKRYRASVLKAAVEGRLVSTEAELARAEHREYEPASVLLERILAERRRRWDAAGRKGTCQEPVAPDVPNLPELPEGWCWATVDEVAEVQGGITKNQKRRSSGPMREVPYLRVANVQRGYLDLSGVTTIAATEAEIAELRLIPGDVLFNEGGDRDKLGRGWVWKGELVECIHQNHVFRARPVLPEIASRFLSWYGNTEGQRYFFDEGKQTTNLASINMTKLRRLPVPLPPATEQGRIVLAVEDTLSIVDAAGQTTAAAIRRCARLRQSILKWAFEGKLADQDPSDEPASMLLDRIKAERATASPTNSGRRSNGRPRKTA